jgi:anti-sigma factor RsiW
MKCKFSENDIALYVGGDVEGPQAFEIETHLIACEACRELAAELRESQLGLQSLRQETVSTAALSAVRTRVLAEIDARTSRRIWARWVYAVAGGVFLIAITVGIVRHIPSIREGRVAAPSSRSSLPLNAAAEVDRSTSDDRSLEPTGPAAPAKVSLPQSLTGRSHPSLAKERNHAPTTLEPPRPVMVKLFTDDPNVVIYWIVEQTGGTL